MIYIVVENQKALKNSFEPSHSKLKKIQGLFKDLHRNLRTFQGKMEIEIQRLFKTGRALQIQKKGRTDKLGVD